MNFRRKKSSKGGVVLHIPTLRPSRFLGHGICSYNRIIGRCNIYRFKMVQALCRKQRKLKLYDISICCLFSASCSRVAFSARLPSPGPSGQLPRMTVFQSFQSHRPCSSDIGHVTRGGFLAPRIDGKALGTSLDEEIVFIGF